MRIRNWEKFQHFKDRRPPWIKLYRGILDDPDWHSLDGDTAKNLVMLWLIASEDETKTGTLPDYKKLSFRLRIKEKELIQLLTRLNGWLIRDDINVISEGCHPVIPETETETETKKPTSHSKRKRKTVSYTESFQTFWSVYPRPVYKQAAFLAWNSALKENGATEEKIIRSAREYADKCEQERTDEKHIRHPESFLHKGRWKEYCFVDATVP